MESRVDNLQYQLFKSAIVGNITNLKVLQKLYVKSVVARIKCVRDTTYISNNFQIKLTKGDKLLLISNLKFSLNFAKFESFLVVKKKSLSFFFENSNLYICCIKCLILNSLLPIIDFTSDRIHVVYRPFRHCQDVFLNLKEQLLANSGLIWMLRTELFIWPNKFSWLRKNFPFYKLTNGILSTFNKTGFKNKFFFLVISFLLNGLVR